MMFTGKVVIVTGATSGIGRATARAFGREGASVLAVGRDESALSAAADDIRADGGSAATCQADVTGADAPGRIVDAAVRSFGGLDVLVNAAGVIASGALEATTDEVWDAMMAVNARAPFRLMRAAAPQLAARKGSVVNVSSVNGLRSFPGVLAYCVSKSALDQLTRCAALELAPLGVRVNAVNPGVTVTNLHRRSGMDEAQCAAFLERSKTTHPAGAARSAGRRRGDDPVPGLKPRRLDDGRDDSDRRRAPSHVRPLGERYCLGRMPSTNTNPSRSASVRAPRKPCA
jgi:NAD(P)-dependent dehydrogenase (short-subunit alcohol dehydrogenase family)